MIPESLFDRERAALLKLQQLVRDRATGEATLADVYQTATEAAEKEVAKARKVIAVARKKATEEYEQTHTVTLDEIDRKYTTAQTVADKKKFDLRKRTVDQYSAALEKARGEYSDKMWTLDSILEANEKQALDQFQDTKRKAGSGKKQVAEIWAKSAGVLARVRLSQSALEPTEDRLSPPLYTDPLSGMQQCLANSEGAAAKLAAAKLPKVIGLKGFVLFLVLGTGAGAGLGFGTMAMPASALATVAGAVLGVILWIVAGVMAKSQVRHRGGLLGLAQGEAARSVRLLEEHAHRTHEEAKREIAERHATDKKKAADVFEPRIQGLEKQLAATLGRIDAEHAKATTANIVGREDDTITENDRFTAQMAAMTAKLDADLAAAEKRNAQAMRAAATTRDETFQNLSNEWFAGLKDVSEVCHELAEFCADRFPPWSKVLAPGFQLPTAAPPGIRLGDYAVDLYALPDGMPFDHRMNPAEPINQLVPAYLPFPPKCAVTLKTKQEGRPAAIATLQAMMLRFLTGLPPGKAKFTIIDPVGLGENFAAFMHLADYDENLVTSRIWTEPGQIEKRLADLTEHMENVIQKYLRNQYKSIEEYNQAAGEVAEPYRVLVIANFPMNFTTEAARRLISIMSSGPACGVCTLVGFDAAYPIPRDFNPADMEQTAFNLVWESGRFTPTDRVLSVFPLTVDGPPDPQAVATVVRRVGEASKVAARVEVPFDYIMPEHEKFWTWSASKGIEVPIGRAGATRRQMFTLGRGTAQHALVAGKTGSGKSTLLHALITNLALMYSPDEVELYLIDFKKGVEFQAYAANRLPHARVIAIESEREFGLSVLQRLDGVLRERGENFRAAGVNDLASYRAARPEEKCPRILFVVDEFQEFFVDDDKLAQESSLLLDRLVRQGRAFGVHVLLGSQTLGGAYSLARSTIDQMAVRIALQCSEADAQLILSKDNSAARLLNRPGEAIYNDANGLVEGNDPFQVVWLADERKDELLGELRERATASGTLYPPPLVFEGSAAADLEKNKDLATLIESPADAIPTGPPLFYLGDPVAIKEPTAAIIRPQSAANVLLIGQHEEAALALMTAGMVSLSAKLRPAPVSESSGRMFTVIDGTPDDGEFADYLRNTADALGLAGAVIERRDLPTALGELGAELAKRQSGESTDRTSRFLFVHGLHRLRELRKPDDDYGFGRRGGEKQTSPGEHFANILREGPQLGVHTVVWCDSFTNLTRALDRAALREFVYRVLFQMSPADSSHLLDSPAASRLGKNRALFSEEGSERPEKFRPYAVPSGSWLRSVGEKLARSGNVPVSDAS